jgi:hypothetical protein
MANYGFLNVKALVKSSISAKHAIGGAAFGTVAIGGVKYALNKITVGGVPLASKIPASVARFTPMIASVLAAFASYAVLSKSGNKKFANSAAVGSLSAGVVFTVSDLLRSSFPAMSDLVTYRLPGMGYVVPSSDGTRSFAPMTRLNGLANLGLLAPDTGNARLNGLAQSAMGATDDYVEYDVA